MPKRPTYKELEERIKELEKALDRKQRPEKKMPDKEAQWRSLVENAPDIITTVDLNGKILFINRNPGDYAGETIVGKSIYDYVPDEHYEMVRIGIEKVFESGLRSRYEIMGPDTKKPTWFISRFGGVKDGCRIVAASIISTNTTKLKKAENALRRAHQELEERVKQRTAELFEANKLLQQEIQERKNAEEELKIKTHNLEEVNIALGVLLKRREEEKTELEEKVLSNVRKLIEPYIDKLRNAGLKENQMTLVDILESNLKSIVSPFSQKLSSVYFGLTPAEIQVADLVKKGKTTKEIAQFLHLGPGTIEFHRQNIRKKIGIRNQKANLRSRLLTLQ
jgi:PAS domain S-box-containing protein